MTWEAIPGNTGYGAEGWDRKRKAAGKNISSGTLPLQLHWATLGARTGHVTQSHGWSEGTGVFIYQSPTVDRCSQEYKFPHTLAWTEEAHKAKGTSQAKDADAGHWKSGWHVERSVAQKGLGGGPTESVLLTCSEVSNQHWELWDY